MNTGANETSSDLVKNHTLHRIRWHGRALGVLLLLALLSILFLVSACSSSGNNNIKDQGASPITLSPKNAETSVSVNSATPITQASPGSPSPTAELTATASFTEGPRISFEQDLFYFGEATPDDEIDYAFNFSNIGNTTLEIQEMGIETLEGC